MDATLILNKLDKIEATIQRFNALQKGSLVQMHMFADSTKTNEKY